MIFSNKKNIDNLNISINGIQIDQVYVSKFWGVQIDSKLTWKSHIDYIGKIYLNHRALSQKLNMF